MILSAAPHSIPASSGKHPARQLYDAGYGGALIPILPPSAALSAGTRIKPESRGKLPGKRLDDETWVGFKGWTKHTTTRDDVDRWMSWGASFGLRTRDYPFVDVDVSDQRVAEALEASIQRCFGGKLLRRYGRAPRVAIPFRTDAPFSKVIYRLRDVVGKDCGAVEVSGDGNQMVIEGVHPKTGNCYEWRDGDRVGGAEILAVHPPNALPYLDAAIVQGRLRDALADAVVPFGLTLDAWGTGNTHIGAHDIEQESLRAPSIDALREVVAAIPNDASFLAHNNYIGIVYAIRAAAGVEHFDDGLDVLLDWTGRYTEGDNNPNDVRRDYETCSPARNGWGFLQSVAQRHGYNSAQWDFDVDPSAVAPAAVAPTAAHDDHQTDMGNAGRFALHFANRLIFAGGRWLKWDERRWTACDEIELHEMAKQVVRAMHAEADRAADSEDRKARRKWAHQSESMQRIRAMVDLARGTLAVSADVLDADHFCINVVNGTLDLRTRDLRAHCPADYITKLAPVKYDADATCPLWLAFLDRIMGEDNTLISALQRMTGYSLTGLTTEQVLFLLYGIGANGKSTFLELLRVLFGDYAAQTKHTTLLQQKNGDGARPEIIKLRGARLITASEVPSGRQFDSATVKALTGGDTLSERDLYKSPIEFRIEGKLWLAANHRPKIEGDDPAMWRRMRLIPFNVTIPEEERDPDLLEKLRAEIPGIFCWAVEGSRKWQAEGLNLPAAVTDATAGYRAEMSALAAFIQARCRLKRGARTTKKDLYGAFEAWCKETGDTILDEGERAFNKEVEKHDPGRIVSKKSGNMCWDGIELLPASLDDLL